MHGAGANVLAPGVPFGARGVTGNQGRTKEFGKGVQNFNTRKAFKTNFSLPPFSAPPPAYRAVENIISNSEKKVHLLIKKTRINSLQTIEL